MRKLLSVITAAACILICPAAAFAAAENSAGAEIAQTAAEKNIDENTYYKSLLNITPTGANENKEAMVSLKNEFKETLTKIVIPETISGYKIVGISEDGFSDCIRLESVTLPKSLTTIEAGAFYCCYELNSIDIPEGVTEIQNYAFRYCSILANVTLPSTLKTIGDNAFEDCFHLKSITIPGSVEEIGTSAFLNCHRLETVMIYNGALTNISAYSFKDAYVKNLYIPLNIESIDYNAFTAYFPITDVYYAGTEEQWNEIAIDNEENSNTALLNALNFHFLTPAPGDPAVDEPVYININIPKQGEYPKINDLKASVRDTSSGNSVELAVDEEHGIDVTDLENGSYTLTVSAKQCAARSYSLTVSGGVISGEAAGGVELHLYGDADGNGMIDLDDVYIANAHAKGKSLLTGYDLAVCDVNQDGKVNIQDVAKINADWNGKYSLWTLMRDL